MGSSPSDWFSAHGEGYCRSCAFIEPLDASGLLANHFRGHSIGQDTDAYRCKGVGKRPWKLTPFRSRLVAFTTRAPQGQCTVCHLSQPLTSTKILARHFVQHLMCAGTGYPPAEPTPTPVSLRRDRG